MITKSSICCFRFANRGMKRATMSSIIIMNFTFFVNKEAIGFGTIPISIPIDNLENKNSSGHDGISNKLLKSIRYAVCKLLPLIIYQMLTSGIFPEAFNKSKTIPLSKKGILLYCLTIGRLHFC